MKPQIENSLGDLKDKVVNASDLVFAKPDKDAFDGKGSYPFLADEFGQLPRISTQTSWIIQIEDYCSLNNLLPEDLIAFHREHSKSKIKVRKGIKTSENDEIKESKHLNWRENNTKRKTGQ